MRQTPAPRARPGDQNQRFPNPDGSQFNRNHWVRSTAFDDEGRSNCRTAAARGTRSTGGQHRASGCSGEWSSAWLRR